MTDIAIPPARPRPEVMDFLLTRRSRPARTLGLPVPTHEQLLPILTAAARVPDHGKLEPWRFIVLGRAALQRLAKLAEARGAALGLDPAQAAKGVAQYADAHLAVAVVKRPRLTEKIPEREQVLSAGAALVTLLNAAQASGWGGNILTGWASADVEFVRDGLGLEPGEWVAGIVFLGTETAVPPERPRPDLGQIVTWVDA